MTERGWLMVLAAVAFLGVAPTLAWLEFSSGSENLNVATALEIRRTGAWGVPTLNAEPRRVAKPPLTAWITAAAIDPATARDMSDLDPAVRARAERRLAWQSRWPFWLSACLTLLAVFEIGRIVADARLGLIAAAVCASNLMFLRFSRAATTDVQLMLWVAVANACFAAMLINGRRWSGAIGASIAVALSFMSKGPVGLVQTVAPVAVFALWSAWTRGPSAPRPAIRRWIGPAVAGVLLFLAIALPWYLYVSHQHPQVWERWEMEVTREGATDLPAGRWYNHASIFPLMVPWVVFFVVGLIVIVRDVIERRPDDRTRKLVFALLLLLVPIIIMSCFRDRKQRYLLPLVAPAAILVARAVVEHLETRRTKNAADRAVVAAHWGILFTVAVGLPIAGMAVLKTLDGARWFSPPLAIAAAVIGGAIVAAGAMVHRRNGAGLVVTTVVVMILAQALMIHGYRNTREGRSEMKPLAAAIFAEYPSAVVSVLPHRRGQAPIDLTLYLNRSIHSAANPPATAPASQPQVVIARQSKGEPEPALPPPWQPFRKFPRDENWWHAFVLPATPGAPPATQPATQPAEPG